MQKLKKHSLQIRGKLALSMGLSLFITTLLLSAIAYINLDKVYAKLVYENHEGYDRSIKIAVENLVSVLEVNEQRYQNGEITEQEALMNAESIVRETRYNDGAGYFWADTSIGLCAVHMNPDYQGEMRYDVTDQEGNYYIRNLITAGSNPGGGYTDFYFPKPGETKAIPKRAYTLKFEPYDWYISTGNYVDDINKAMAKERQEEFNAQAFLLSSSIIISVLAVLFFYIRLKGITGPLAKVSKRIQLLANGDAQTPPVPIVLSNDEMQTLTQSTEKLLISFQTIVKDLTTHLSSMAQGDMTTPMTRQYMGDFIPIQDSLQEIYSSLNQILETINQLSYAVNSSANQVADAAHVLADGATEQAGAVEELSISVAAVSSQVGQNAAGVSLATSSVSKTVNYVKDGNEKMQQMLFAIERIKSSSDEINSITQSITSIASKTNLLAINAAIESSHAGSAGKGFAVVATEVRDLAGKVSEAAKSTSILIENSIKAVTEGEQVARETEQIFKTVSEGAIELQGIIENIDKASQEQAVAIGQITSGMEQISAVVQNNAATAEQSSASSQVLSAHAATLRKEIARFKIKNDVPEKILVSAEEAGSLEAETEIL
jgi:methyl-accepting chemotaxis protein